MILTKRLVGRYSDFVKGEDHFFSFGRGRVDTVRSKFNHVLSSTSDGTYNYMATVPNNRDHKTFVISKQLMKDMVTSGEFTPKTSLLKEGRSLGELVCHRYGCLRRQAVCREQELQLHF